MTILHSLASNILGAYDRIIESFGEGDVLYLGGRFSGAHFLEVDPSTVYLKRFSLLHEDTGIRWSHLLRINFKIQIFGGKDVSYQRLQSLANMDGLLGSNVVKGDIDIDRVSVNHVDECFRAFYLLCYRELDFTLLHQLKVRTVVTPGTT